MGKRGDAVFLAADDWGTINETLHFYRCQGCANQF
jgi:hypothetical protein